MIEARDVSVAIGGKRILHGIDFRAEAGEITAIVGPNGSGKSTFIKALSGDLSYLGEIRLNGRRLSTLKPWETALQRAVLPQSTSLSFPFTVREIVSLGLSNGHSGASSAEVERLPEKALERVDLAGFAGRFYQELSGGEQQRVQLARVLCQVWTPTIDGKPRWLFLDEPVSSLDIRHQLVIMNVARDFAERGGGVIAVLHDLNLTAMYADHVAMIHKGRLASAGTPRAVLTDDLIERVFDCCMRVRVVPSGNVPFVLPQSVGL